MIRKTEGGSYEDLKRLALEDDGAHGISDLSLNRTLKKKQIQRLRLSYIESVKKTKHGRLPYITMTRHTHGQRRRGHLRRRWKDNLTEVLLEMGSKMV
jgi:hypothetical protein